MRTWLFVGAMGQPAARTSRRHLVGLLAGVAAFGGTCAGEDAAARGRGKKKKKANPFRNIPVTGNTSENNDKFKGAFTVANFHHDEQLQKVLAVGTLTGTITKEDQTTEPVGPLVDIEFEFADAGAGNKNGAGITSGSVGSIFVGIANLLILLGQAQTQFTINGFAVQPKLAGKSRVKAGNQIMASKANSDLAGVAAGLNQLLATYPK